MKEVNQVYETNDYSKFKTLEGNRSVNKLHVKRLRDSFSRSYLQSPIIINENDEIIDGQHRFLAAKHLGLPINYIICKGYGLEEVQILNTNMKNWTKHDYLNAFCDLGYPEYLRFRHFMRKFPDFGITSCETMLTGELGRRNIQASKDNDFIDSKSRKYAARDFEEGNLIINDYNYAVECGHKILQIKPFYDGFNRKVFVVAMMGIFRIEEYNHDQLISKLENQPSALQHCSNVTQYKLMIEEIYNYRSRNKISLRF